MMLSTSRAGDPLRPARSRVATPELDAEIEAFAAPIGAAIEALKSARAEAA